MKRKNLLSILTLTLAFIFCIGLAGCNNTPAVSEGETNLSEGGVLYLSVNPEIAISYDESGTVTEITARNNDAKKVIEGYEGFLGKECSEVVSELVNRIGEAGYFVEEVDGKKKQITIEIEPGSVIPSEVFIDEVIAKVRERVAEGGWKSPLTVEGRTDYGITDYIDTDYGTGNDGVTDYRDTDYGPFNDGITDYDNNINDSTDYGEGNDGITDYDDFDSTDYGPNGDGDTDYNDTDYGPYNDGITDYDNNINNSTDYGEGNDGITDYDSYDSTDYGPNGDGDTNYNDTDYGPYNDGVTDYNAGNTNYGGSNYGTNYGSNYGDSGYDD